MQVTSDMVSPIRTITDPLACLANRPVSRLICFSPMVRSTILRDDGVLDMENYLRGRGFAAREKVEEGIRLVTWLGEPLRTARYALRGSRWPRLNVRTG